MFFNELDEKALGRSQSRVSKSMEKLSSGTSISRGADDASGMAISEKCLLKLQVGISKNPAR